MSRTTSVIRTYHDSWTAGDFGTAVSLLADDLTVEVPVNQYPTAESFGAALKTFGSLATSVELHAAMSDGNDAMLLYDMDLPGLGMLRVAEHFTVRDGKIVRIRQVHDTAALRESGLVG
ncbi:MAG: nuclear transport factor 2 family protein [Actinomycetota bacterium]|nr:nuclear transport factor 2 family protein [Actinomycetota bacterium]